jgi:hypothetical protein
MAHEYPLYRPASASLPRNMDDILKAATEWISQRAGDSISTSPITAQRLEPDVMPVFVRDYPFYDLIEKVPSNGIAHTFLQQTAPSQATTPHTIAETGTVTDDTNSYSRKTTNIALFAERRGVTIKAKFAGLQAGGPSTDLMAREIEGGLLTIARDAQNEMLSYTETYSSSGGATDPNGAYDANGLNGLRYIVYNQAPPENSVIVDVRTLGWTDQRVLTGIRQVVQAIYDKGGRPNLVVTSARGSNALFQDQMELVRYFDQSLTEITPGRSVRRVSTDSGDLPVLVVPGGSGSFGSLGIGTWTSAGATYQDIFVVQTDTLEIPYLGAPEPTVIRIPLAVDGTLRELAIPFALYGLAAKAPQYLGRVSLRIA